MVPAWTGPSGSQPGAPRLLPVVDVGGKGGFVTGVLEGCVFSFFSFWWVDTDTYILVTFDALHSGLS